MPTPFAALDAMLSGAVNSTFAEVFTFRAFVPSDDVDLPLIPDATRPDFTALAIWVAQTSSATPHARGAMQDDNAHNWTTSQPQITIDDALLLWRPRMGDRAVRVEDGAVYQIARAPRPDGMGHTTIDLSDRKR